MSGGSVILTVYRGATAGLAIFAPLLLKRRERQGKEDALRLGERSGIASRPRPPGQLVWLHGASVGEAIALLPLIEALRARNMQIVLTTGTVTSAGLMQTRLPQDAIHQFVPLDVPQFVRRFLDHWQPDLALFAESELWPNCVMETARRKIPLALVNARLSERSSRRWKKLPATIGSLLGHIDVTLAQTQEDAARFAELGARKVGVPGNLKYDVPALPCDQLELSDLKVRVGARPVWVAASTHEGEEEIAMAAHTRLTQHWPNLLTIIVPRHPERGASIASLAAAQDLNVCLRSRKEKFSSSGCIYVADTIGELGLFYRVANIVFVGRSLIRHGGQNPIEPAKLGAAILHGPHIANFGDVYRDLDATGGAIEVAGTDALGDTLAELFADSARTRGMARAASETVEQLGGATGKIMQAIEPYLTSARPERD